MIFRKTEGNEKSLELDKDIVDNENLSTDRRYILLKKHYIGLDVFRMVAVLSIFAFHTNIHLNAKYGILSDFISTEELKLRCSTSNFHRATKAPCTY